jgi:lipopolysaccharide export system permease protein
MMIFDRYLLRRYWHVFFIGYLALFGLYFVIDVFTNVNDFLDQDGGTLAIVAYMAQYYSYRACYFFGLIGGTMEVISAMVALALVQKYGELNPVLSAGVSTFRLMRPLLIGAVFVNGLIFLNQELIIPRIALELQMSAGTRIDVSQAVEPVTDFATDIMILGKRLNLKDQSIEEAEFVLKPTKVSEKLTTLSAREAVPVPARGKRRGGWRLKGASQKYDSLQLTAAGRKIIRPGKQEDELFVMTDVGFDRLYNRDKHYEYLSTWELMRRIRNPSFSHRSIRSQSLYLHTRLTQPILNLIVVGVGVPFVVRKESVSLLTNLAICCGVMGAMFAIDEAFQYLGKVSILSPEMAVWAPIILWGTGAAWFTGMVRT